MLMTMIIGVTGYGGTGASACIDLLKEFDGVQSYPSSTEFQILQQPDGIIDLYYQLVDSRRRLNVNTAIIRFMKQYTFLRSDRLSEFTDNQYQRLSEAYIHALIETTWKGKSSYDPQDILSRFESPIFKYFNAIIRRILWLHDINSIFPPTINRYYTSIDKYRFINLTQDYLKSILSASGFDLDKPILLEQLFNLQNPLEGSEFFDTASKSIIVDRDPRDFYVLVTHYWGKNSTGYMPNDGDVYKFVNYYRGLHNSCSMSKDVFYLQFEDLIFDYTNTVHRLEEFLGIRHISPDTYFHPQWSINNTKLFERHSEYHHDIKYIEQELSDYLYDFNRYSSTLDFVPEEMDVFDVNPNDMNFLLRRK